MRALLFSMVLSLSACGSAMEDDYARKTAEDAQRRAIDADAEIQLLRQKLTDLEDRQSRLFNYTKAVDDAGNSLRSTVNTNAQAANNNSAKAMTERGACGREWVEFENGTTGWRNKTCTSNDLK
ncbi:hypothetical protein [Sphingobium yanoikuyae]|uniref:hypothetical protein n=1 Tax=Sphingobium yanoikuyae TaxID=13690 RepID=UPI0013775463|nr:hypothetical protein [Sphingobium yanoikuyae]NBB38661.1 hypothetical protein [Sphingobium yanoikuyae]